MTEVFFILTIVFAGYVVFSVVSDEKKTAQKNNQAEKVTSPVTPEVKVATPKVAASVKESTAPKAELSEEKVTEASEFKVVGDSLRNPETGGVAKIPSNYRFSKRWIKDALVKEGLLDKVYKNNELDDEANAKIYQALADLHAMEKYQA